MSEQRHDYFPMHPFQHSHTGENPDPEPAIFSETKSLELLQRVNSEAIQHALTQWVDEIKDWAKDNSYLIGHIKIFAEGQENLWLSSTGKDIHVKHSPGWQDSLLDKMTLSVTAIIFGPTKTILEEAAQAKLQVILKSLEI
ncbi:hypothetical protein Desor_1369 [Desulfosporosinus orientis DSM 765]|uniref:Uncharacterized protein n=1 Tax=Desulfosporosinus orientis (strain ATCC 19365 / DSM 765 / NCIMB 8382 / VKM B-1628 / Singapore I) TaxID=768706 RepID=G7W5U2_DESOD|nr:hypothetical protein [Desulfosporosinus orientis]AET67030.1 hypothetical protein Desor_1369 [Desulfosporosinus orientis DSM 765]